jgi:hypothetical protein
MIDLLSTLLRSRSPMNEQLPGIDDLGAERQGVGIRLIEDGLEVQPIIDPMTSGTTQSDP